MTHIPWYAIAGNHDYGRLSKLAELGIAIDVSMLEKLVLAEVRCHLVCVKIVARDKSRRQRVRNRLSGHSLPAEAHRRR